MSLDVRINTNRVSSINNVEVERKALHEDIEIKCFYEGSSVLMVGTQTVTASAGDILVVNPYEFHATVDPGTDENKGKYHLIMVPLDYFGESADLDLRNLLLVKHKAFETLFKNDARLSRILRRVAKEYDEKGAAYRVAIKGLLMEFFAILLRKGLKNSGTSLIKSEAFRSYKLIEPALRKIRDNYAENITVEQLAELCQVSKHYFCRVFKSVTGKTSMEYLRDYRMSVSKALIASTDKSITQIAELCGFESANYFCRCYKQDYGCSPSRYRKIIRG